MLEFTFITKRYTRKHRDLVAVDSASFTINQGEFAALRGPSGSGKTSLLLIAGGMLHPTAGTVTLDGKDLYALSPAARATLRADRIGYIFQLFNLVPYLSATDNVLLGPRGPRAQRHNALELLDRLGLADRAAHRPAELSVGERQRVAVARAILHEPDIILADEPIAGLDDQSAAVVIECLREQHQRGATILLATHSRAAEFNPTREFAISDGALTPSELTAEATA
jgi:putative ABC transport system ATP-binding protein